MITGDPSELIKKNPLNGKKIDEFLKKKKELIEAAQKAKAVNSAKKTEATQVKPVQTNATELATKIQK